MSGIGSYAYEGKRGNHGEIDFVVGRYIADMALTTNTQLKSFAALNALARVVAGKL